MTKQNRSDIILTVLYASLSYASFVSVFFSVLLRHHVKDPWMISCVLVSQKLIKLFFNTPLAVIADMRGTRVVFLAASVLSGIYGTLLFFDSIMSVVLLLLLHGIVVSILSQKVETRIYNILKSGGSENAFTKVFSLFFIASDVMMFAVGFGAVFVFNLSGYFGVFLANLGMSIITFTLAWFLKNIDISQKKSARHVVKGSYVFLKKYKLAALLAFILSLYNFFGWQFAQVFKTMFLFEGVRPESVIKFYSFTRLCMGCGSFVAYFTIARMSLFGSIRLWATFLAFMFTTALLHKKIFILGSSFPLTAIPILCYALIFAPLQMPIIFLLERVVPSSIRATVNSVVGDIAIILNIACNLGIGIIANRFNYTISMATISGVFIILTAIIVATLRLKSVSSGLAKIEK